MKKYVKIILWSIIGFITTFIFYLNYQTHFSEAARKGKSNVENIKAVKEGMSTDEVLLIMGKPDTIVFPNEMHPKALYYDYFTNDESFANATVSFDSTMKVQKTYYPKSQ